MNSHASRFTFHTSSHPVAILLLLGGLAAFLPSLSAYFVSDDFVLLSWTHVHSASEVASFFDPNTFWFYRPLVKVFYWVGQSLFGLRATPFHLFSIALHGVNSYLLYRLVLRQVGATWPMAIASGLIFLLNGHHAETVAWSAAMGDLIAAFCILMALLLFQRFRESGRFGYLAGSLAIFVVGLLARETAVILPLLLLLNVLILEHPMEHLHKERPIHVRIWRAHPPRVLAGLLAYGVVLAAYFAVVTLGKAPDRLPLERGGLQFHWLNLQSILLGILDYVHGLVPGGSYLTALPLDTMRSVVWVEWAVIIMVGLLIWRSGRRIMLYGFVRLLVTPLLFIFFSPPAERYFYLPSIGYAILVGALLTDLPRFALRFRSPVLVSVAKATGGLLLAALLLSQGVTLTQKEAAWESAGQATGGVLYNMKQAVPTPHDYAAFYFVDLSPDLNGVPLFQSGLQQAVQLVYDNSTLQAYSLSCEQLSQTDLARYSFFFRFTGDGAEQFQSVEQCK